MPVVWEAHLSSGVLCVIQIRHMSDVEGGKDAAAEALVAQGRRGL